MREAETVGLVREVMCDSEDRRHRRGGCRASAGDVVASAALSLHEARHVTGRPVIPMCGTSSADLFVSVIFILSGQGQTT